MTCTATGSNKKVGLRPPIRATRFRAKEEYIPAPRQKQGIRLRGLRGGQFRSTNQKRVPFFLTPHLEGQLPLSIIRGAAEFLTTRAPMISVGIGGLVVP